MKKIIIITILLLPMVAEAQLLQNLHADVQILGTTRGRGMVSGGIVYRTTPGIELSANVSAENGHNTTYSLYGGYRLIYTDSDNDRGSGIVLYAGAGYSNLYSAAKAEIGDKPWGFVAGVKWLENYGMLDVKYVANTFAVTLGYRFFNHRR